MQQQHLFIKERRNAALGIANYIIVFAFTFFFNVKNVSREMSLIYLLFSRLDLNLIHIWLRSVIFCYNPSVLVNFSGAIAISAYTARRKRR